MAQIPPDFGSESARYEMFVGALHDLTPGETVAVGITLLNQSHILTGEKSGYGHLFIQVNDPEWNALVAEEYRVAETNIEAAVADAVSLATRRFLRLRVDSANVQSEELPRAEF